MKDHFQIFLKAQEKCAQTILANQITEAGSFEHGGFADPSKLVNPGWAAENLLVLLPLYCCQDSCYFKNETLFTRILYALEYLERVQRPDGTFDLIVTNFYSSPDTGFIVQNLANTYMIAEKYSTGRETEDICLRLEKLIKSCSYGMAKGGFHTPNHRWVIASALMMAHTITGINIFKSTAEIYLNEGIDCDENGEFTERSSGIYNATNDNALIILSREMKRDDLLEHVKRNLNMMFTYMEPDGTVFTENSTRQDKSAGSAQFYPTSYYPLYLYMAYRFNDGRFASMADTILKQSILLNRVPNLLYFFMLHTGLKEFSIGFLPIPSVYEKFYESSGIVRIRRENTSYTLLKGNSRFLVFRRGSLSCCMKLCASFFAVAQFKADKLEKTDNGYRLSFKTQGSYRMPLDEAPESPDWASMNHSSRKVVNIIRLNFTADISETEEGLTIHIESEGCDRVPVKVEMCFSAGCIVEGESFMIHGDAGNGIIVKSGFVNVKKGSDNIRVGPGFGKHAYASQMRGSEPQSASEFTVYFTGYTPIKRDILIQCHE